MRTDPQTHSSGSVARVRALNDALRTMDTGECVLVTASIEALPRDEQRAILAAVQGFAAFNPDNDPHGEHDCAFLRVGIHEVVFKIDTYDLDLLMHSPDPSAPTVTCRILTNMLAEDY